MPQLPPLDTHAHLSSDLPARDLEGLGAVVLAATRSVDDFEAVALRTDRVTIWGVGSHPSLVGVQRAFDPYEFQKAVARTPFVSEIGLDGSSRVPMTQQIETFRAVLDILERTPRIASVHSHQARTEVLDALTGSAVRAGIVLHWWLGDDQEIARAIALGAYFSLNYSMVRGGDAWRSIPLDRVLTETDHPAGDRFSPKPRQPGRVQPVEDALARVHQISPLKVRDHVWRNFSRLVSQVHVDGLLPEVVASMLRAVY